MSTPQLIIEAVPAAFFAMDALWAAGSNRHWFVRTAVVAMFLLVVLFIPAYEVLIQFGVGVLAIVVGLALWRNRRRAPTASISLAQPPAQRPSMQLSLQAMLLLMAVVAVVTAVAARAPALSAYQWLNLCCAGLMIGVVGLSSVWVALGAARWQLRLLALPLVVAAVSLVLLWFPLAAGLLLSWLTRSTSLPQRWQSVLDQGLLSGYSNKLQFVSLGMSILILWQLLVTRAGWFDPFHETANRERENAPSRGRRIARVAALAMFALVAAVPLYIFYRLLTPTPIPDLTAPRPNGYDQLLSAGQEVVDVDANFFWGAVAPSQARLQQALTTNAAALEKIHRALQGDCRFPLFIPPTQGQLVPVHMGAIGNARYALLARSKLVAMGGTPDESISANLDLLRFSFADANSSGIHQYERLSPDESQALTSLWQSKAEFRDDDRARLIEELQSLDARRAPWQERLARQQIIDENSRWDRHLASLIDRWSDHGENAEYELRIYRMRTMEMRSLIVDLAVDTFQSQNGRLPNSWQELVPQYLPKIPDDPFAPAGQPFEYLPALKSYELWSRGAERSRADYNATILFQTLTPQPPAATATTDETEAEE